MAAALQFTHIGRAISRGLLLRGLRRFSIPNALPVPVSLTVLAALVLINGPVVMPVAGMQSTGEFSLRRKAQT